MTLLFCDSFDHYTTIAQKWTLSATASMSAGNGRNGTAALSLSSIWSGGGYVTKTLTSSPQTLIAGVAWKTPAITAGVIPLGFLDNGTIQCDVRLDAAGHLLITRNGTTLATSTNSILVDIWYYLELKVTIDNSPNGQATLKVNGVTWASVVNGDTQATANASANQVKCNHVLATSSTLYDDLYVCDDQGSYNKDFLGDVRVECIMPDGAGATADWDPSAGANYECVDEIPPDSDTTYVSTATATEVDTYEFDDVTPTTGTVLAVVTYMFARKDDAGARVINSVVRPVATDYASGASHSVGDSYAYYSDIYEENEEVAGVWTIATVNASEFGVKLES